MMFALCLVLCVQEFDQENTQHVRQLFSALDELLYEGKACDKSESLRRECKEWNTHSPHLRYAPITCSRIINTHKEINTAQ